MMEETYIMIWKNSEIVFKYECFSNQLKFLKNSTFHCYCAFIKTRDLVKE